MLADIRLAELSCWDDRALGAIHRRPEDTRRCRPWHHAVQPTLREVTCFLG